MYRKFLNARSPLRLLEKGLHGGLGAGNLGVVIAGHGLGKTSFLVDVAIDELLRGGRVLHVAQDQSVGHVRSYYDTIFQDLASSTHLEDEAAIHADIDRRRSIRAYPGVPFHSATLREAVKLESETLGSPSLLVIEGAEVDGRTRDEVEDLKRLAGELDAEIWLSVSAAGESVGSIPSDLEPVLDLLSVVLALEPGDGIVNLRALKDHDNPDLSELHVSLDPSTCLLVRS